MRQKIKNKKNAQMPKDEPGLFFGYDTMSFSYLVSLIPLPLVPKISNGWILGQKLGSLEYLILKMKYSRDLISLSMVTMGWSNLLINSKIRV